MNSLTRWFSTEVKFYQAIKTTINHLVQKVLVISVVNHIEFAYIRPVKTILVHSPLFLERFTFSDEFYRLVGFLTAAENHLVEKPMVYSARIRVDHWPNLYICYRSKDPFVLSSPLISVYSDWSLDSYISEWSIDPFISERSVNPYISERSIDPYIQTGQWIPIFLVGRLIPIF